jgi:tetratricopeptide (TPR) repeat protein
VVTVYEVGTIDERPFVAMELVRGQVLGDWQATPRPWRACIEVYAQAGAGLAAAHAGGLVHRDFKPANCILDEHGRVRVLDFGLARDARLPAAEELDDATAVDSTPPDDALSQALTRSGAVMGTLAYMAPEQLLGRPADARSDQFAFCVALYEALHGQRPFAGSTSRALLYAIGEQRIAPLRSRGDLPPVPAALERIVRRGLSVSRDDRHPSMAALVAALTRVPRARRRARAAVLGLATVVMGGGIAAAWPTAGPCDGLRELPAPAWTPARRDAAREAVLAVGGPRGSAVWNGVAEALDGYAAQWVEARASACEATHVQRSAGPHTQELRLACLDRRMHRMSALVDQLVLIDLPGVAQAVVAAQSLPSLTPCDDPQALLAIRAEVAPRDQPRHQAALGLVDEAWALHVAGRATEALARADTAVAAAAPLDSGSSTVAEAALVRGSVHLAARRSAPARADLHAALQAAERARDDALVLEVARSLAALEAWTGSHAAVDAWLVVARGRGARHDDPRDAIALEVTEGLALEARGEHAAAIERMHDAIARYRALEPAPALELARALRLLGEASASAGDSAAAREAYAEALELTRRNGALAMEAEVLHDLGVTERDAGAFGAARERFEAALALQREIFGERAPISVHTRIGLADVLAEEGELEAAEHQALAARDLFGTDPALDPEARALLSMLLASVHRRLGRNDAALDDYRQAREGFSAMPEPDEGAIAMADSGAADCLALLGRVQEARARYEQALGRLRAHVPPDHPRWLFPQRGLGRLLVEAGDHEAAVPLLERALAMHAQLPADPQEHARIEWDLGRALHASGRDPARGHALVLRARTALAHEGTSDDRTRIDAWLTEHPRPAPTPLPTGER